MNDFVRKEDLDALRRESVQLHLPNWLMGGARLDVAAMLGWELHAEDSHYRARSNESVVGAVPGLLKVSRVGLRTDPGNAKAYWRLENRLSELDEMHEEHAAAIAERTHQRYAKVYPEELTARLASFQVKTMGASSASQLPALAAEVMDVWLDTPSLQHRAMFLIEADQTLRSRYGVARALLHTGAAAPDPDDGGLAFASARGLLQDIDIGLSPYLAPLLTSLSPFLWGVTAPRAGGVVVISFGAALLGRELVSSELMESAVRGGGFLGDAPDVDGLHPSAFGQALRWWVARLDLVFSHLTDPTNYEVDEFYNPPSAMERMLAFAQLCRSVHTIGTSNDSHARLLALFHSLDSLAGTTTWLNFDKLTTERTVEKIVADLRTAIPEALHPILLPRVDSALAALRAVQRGFFMRSRLTDAGLVRPDSSGVDTEVPLATAAKEWIRLLRNSQHAYDKTPTVQDRALLASHDGVVPPRLPELAWIALLAILVHPERLQRRPRPSPRTRRPPKAGTR